MVIAKLQKETLAMANSEAAIDAIYTYSAGIARLINKAATNCLIYGAQSQKPIIDDHMVKLVIGSEMA